MNTLALIQLSKAVACGVAAALVFVAGLGDKYGLKRVRPWVAFLLIALSLFAVPAYLDFGQFPKHGRFMNPHGWFHYYLGAKYSEEVGYNNLYGAVVVANAQNNGGLVNRRVRDLETYRIENGNAVLADQERYMGEFSEARWAEFANDVEYFQSITIPRRWPGVVTDKGYNATPSWNMVGALLTNATDTDSVLHMGLLLALDPLLLLVMLIFIYRAFDWRVMLFVLIYFGTSFAFFLYGVNEIRGAFLRWDWLALLGISICLLKMNHYKSAGGLMAYAGMARIFPFILLFGMGAKFAWDLLGKRRVDRSYVEFFGAFSIATASLLIATIVWDGGVGQWQEFFDKISVHDSGLSPQRTGFKYVFLNTFEGGAGKVAFLQEHKPWWWAIQAVVLAISFISVRRLENYEAVAFSYVPLYFLTAPTTYYQIALLLTLFMFLPNLREAKNATGAALTFFISIAFIVLNITGFLESAWALSALCSWILLVYVAYMTFVAITRKGEANNGNLESGSASPS